MKFVVTKTVGIDKRCFILSSPFSSIVTAFARNVPFLLGDCAYVQETLVCHEAVIRYLRQQMISINSCAIKGHVVRLFSGSVTIRLLFQ